MACEGRESFSSVALTFLDQVPPETIFGNESVEIIDNG
jgi:hypothetical protein